MDFKVKLFYYNLEITRGEGCILAGNEYYNRGNYNLAIQMYNFVIKGDNANPVVYFNRACAFMANGNYYQAIEDFSKCIEQKQFEIEALE